jgi:hypothetical protein
MSFASTALDVLAATGIVAALATSGIGLVVAKSSEWWQWRRGAAKHLIQLDLPAGAELRNCRWKVLYVQDGHDEITARLSERERWFARLKNEIESFEEVPGNPTSKRVELQFYRPLGIQFKCFVEVDDRSAADSARSLLEASGCREIAVSADRREAGQTFVRVWFLHPDTGDPGAGARYRIVKAFDGAKNNFFYPV